MPSHCMDLSARVRFNAESLADLEVSSRVAATGVWVRGVGAWFLHAICLGEIPLVVVGSAGGGWRVAVLAHGGMSYVL